MPQPAEQRLDHRLIAEDVVPLVVGAPTQDGLMWKVTFSQSKWIDNVNAQTANATTLGDNSGPQFFYRRSLEQSRSTNDMPRRLGEQTGAAA
jgi:hypothetical protein